MKTLIRFLSVLAAALCAPLAASAQAQWTPDRQVRIVVPFAAGAAADNGMRAISDRLAAALGQAVVIDNRPGAGGVLGAQVGASSPADGYTLIGGSDPPFTISPHLQKLPYDPLKDFQPVSLMADLPLVLVVRSDLNIHSVRDLIQAAKAAPGKLTAGSSGNGSSGHLAVEMLKSGAGVNLLHVPYKGMPQAVTDMLGGRVDVTFSSLGPVMPHVKAGKLRVIGISTTKRFSGLPDIPTLAESGVPGFDLSVWVGLHYPAGVPQAAVRRVNAEVDKILQTPEVQARFKELGYVAVGGSTDVMATRIQSDYQRFGKLIRDARITAD
jgi:tripartite-type tricarboxylate transporter receptor subunit TctC